MNTTLVISIEKELQNIFSDRFRRVRVQYSKIGQACITIFPVSQSESYRIIVINSVASWNTSFFKKEIEKIL